MDARERIRTYIQTQAEANRKYYFGQTVEVYGENGEYVCDGIVAEVRCAIHGDLDILSVKAYALGNRYIMEDLGSLRYEVYAKKSDGKSSKKHIFETQHMFRSFEEVKPGLFERFIKPKS